MTTMLLVCAECRREDGLDERGWQGHLVDLDEDGQDEVAFFCPRCAAREFGCQERGVG